MKKERVFPGALLQASNGAVAQAVAKKQLCGWICRIKLFKQRLKILDG